MTLTVNLFTILFTVKVTDLLLPFEFPGLGACFLFPSNQRVTLCPSDEVDLFLGHKGTLVCL